MFRGIGKAAASPGGRWIVCGIWIAIAIALYPAAARIDEETQNETGAGGADSESARVADLLEERFDAGETDEALLVYRARDDAPLNAEQREAIAAHALAASDVELVTGEVRAPFGEGAERGQISQDGRVAFTVVSVDRSDRKLVPDAIEGLRALPPVPDADFHVTGPVALESDYDTSLESADIILLVFSAFLVVGLLLAVYRAPIMALIPLFVVGISYLIATGLLTLLTGAGLQIDSASISLLLVLMFGAGTDYCLLYASRYSAALRSTEDAREAAAATLPISGPAILASGTTVALALLTMLAADIQTTKNLGPVNAIGVMVALCAALTLLPALLALFGRRAFWPVADRVAFQPIGKRDTALELPIDAPRSEAYLAREGRWTRVGRAVILRPRRVLAGSIAVLAVCCIGLVTYEGMANPVDMLHDDQESVQGYDVLAETFPPGVLAPTTILVEGSDEGLEPGDLGIARAAVSAVGGSQEVPDSEERSSDGQIATFSIFFADDPYKERAYERIRSYRETFDEIERPGVEFLVGDSTARELDYNEAASDDNKIVIPLALIVIAIVLAILLRALVAPLYLIGTVVFSYASTMGLSFLFFTQVLGEEAFDPAVPTFTFIFLVALGVDYNIFLMSRVREEAAIHGTREGLSRALGATGPVITSAGLVLAGTFSVLMTIPVTPLFQLGFSVALGVLIDTFIVRTLIVPAITSLLGERTWWPSRARTEHVPMVVSDPYRAPLLLGEWRAPVTPPDPPGDR